MQFGVFGGFSLARVEFSGIFLDLQFDIVFCLFRY